MAAVLADLAIPCSAPLAAEAEAEAVDEVVVPMSVLQWSVTPTWSGQTCSAPMFLWSGRTTSVDVMSVTNTVKVATERTPENPSRHCRLPYEELGSSTSQVATPLAAAKGAVSRQRSHKMFLEERDQFVARLLIERKVREDAEASAVTKIAAAFRAYRTRPHAPLRPKKLSEEDAMALILADAQLALSRLGFPLLPGLGMDGRVQARGLDIIQRTKRRARSRRLRAVDEAAATDIQRVTRGYMGRLWAKRLQRERHEIYRDGCARCIQAAWARYEWRRGWWIRAEGVRNEAATVVQARWRGVSGRRHLAKQRRMDRIRARRAASATKIQSAVRMWLTIKRLKKKLLAIDGGTEGCPASPKQVK